MVKKKGIVKVLSKVVSKVFKSHPEVVEDAKTMNSARNYLTDLVMKEFDDVSKLDLDAVFNEVKWKLWSLKDKS